jgi:hypothetical protein
MFTTDFTIFQAHILKGRCELICEQFKMTRDSKNEVLISLKIQVFYYFL